MNGAGPGRAGEFRGRRVGVLVAGPGGAAGGAPQRAWRAAARAGGQCACGCRDVSTERLRRRARGQVRWSGVCSARVCQLWEDASGVRLR
ncbi:Protein of unknown function [Gryllus bimaculatus]|nr:Protein of unknown function [Gryllus bimaculatus]